MMILFPALAPLLFGGALAAVLRAAIRATRCGRRDAACEAPSAEELRPAA